jgi:hypothetical protein
MKKNTSTASGQSEIDAISPNVGSLSPANDDSYSAATVSGDQEGSYTSRLKIGVYVAVVLLVALVLHTT